MDPHTILKDFTVSMSQFGITSFTDLLPRMPYEDACVGNYEKRNFMIPHQLFLCRGNVGIEHNIFHDVWGCKDIFTIQTR